jgi:hypothetical protein
MDDLREKLKALLDSEGGRCLCGFSESCESCSPHSQYNRLRSKLEELVHGPPTPMTPEDYGRSYTFSKEDLE